MVIFKIDCQVVILFNQLIVKYSSSSSQMKKHLLHLAICFVACFSILNSFSNTNTGYTVFKAIKDVPYKWVSTPSSENSSHVPFTLSSDVEITEDDQTNNEQREHIGVPAINELESLTEHCYVTKLRLTSPSLNIFEDNRLPYFILYHSWKSDLI